MSKYVAFLRAINVGGHTVKMDELRRLFEALGFANVKTFIASGNVSFDAPSKSGKALEKKIASHLHESLGYEVVTFIRTPAELIAIAQYRPFSDAEMKDSMHAVYVGFLADPPSAAATQRLMALASSSHRFRVHEREVYWLSRQPTSESIVSGALIEKTLGMAATFRNTTTVKKIAAKYS